MLLMNDFGLGRLEEAIFINRLFPISEGILNCVLIDLKDSLVHVGGILLDAALVRFHENGNK